MTPPDSSRASLKKTPPRQSRHHVHAKPSDDVPDRRGLQAARWLALVMALVFGGLGVLAIVTGYAPDESTRYGLVGPFFGEDARAVGWLLVCLGAAPLAFWSRTAAQAAWWMALWLMAGVGGTLGQAYKLF